MHLKKYFLLAIPLFIFGAVYSQKNSSMSEKWNYSDRAFIKNIGQFDNRNWNSNSEIEYGYAENPFYIFFTKQGVTYRLDKMIKNPKRKEDKTVFPKRTNVSELITANWIGSNSNVEIVSSDKTNNYFSYAVEDDANKNVKNLNRVPGFKNVIYKNIYDNIDIEYTIHPEGGVKYDIILHPGANPSHLKLKYTTAHTSVKDEKIDLNLNGKGQLEINTSLGAIIEHAPISFYEESGEKIESNYTFENNVLSFNLENYDHSKKVVIDPWIVSPTYQTSSAAWEVETDGVGNVYSIGGESPMELKKYDINGNPLSDVSVTLYEKVGEDDWKIVETKKTDKKGDWEFHIRKDKEYKVDLEKNNYISHNEIVPRHNDPSELRNDVLSRINPFSMKYEAVKDLVIQIDNIYFDFNSSYIQKESFNVLEKVKDFLNDNPEIKIELSAHTDCMGKDSYNLWLSNKRAESSKKYLVDAGISANRIIAKGYGEQRMIVLDCELQKRDDSEAQKNRRVEVKIL